MLEDEGSDGCITRGGGGGREERGRREGGEREGEEGREGMEGEDETSILQFHVRPDVDILHKAQITVLHHEHKYCKVTQPVYISTCIYPLGQCAMCG